MEPAARIGATDEEPERLEQYRFGVETMEEHAIRVLTTERLPLVAETARQGIAGGLKPTKGTWEQGNDEDRRIGNRD